MSEPIEWIRDPDLTQPMLLAAFGGWGDASDAATGAVRWLISQRNGHRIARIRPDDFFDFTVARPSVRLEAGGQRAIVWPAIDVFGARAQDGGSDLLLLHGREPHLRWPDFVETVLQIARRCGVSRALTLGAFFGPVLHRAPVQLTGYASERAVIERMSEQGVIPSTYEGQTGIASVLHDAFRRAGVPSLSLWAAVPFYLGSIRPNPRATHALLSGVTRIAGLDVDLARMSQAADYFDDQIEAQVRDNRELRELIERLAAEAATLGGLPESAQRSPEPAAELPSAEAIIKDLEDFLRGRRTEGGSE